MAVRAWTSGTESRVPTSRPNGPVVVGIDGHVASRAALDLAADEAVARDTRLEIVHVITRPDTARARRDAGDLLDAAVYRVRVDRPTLSVSRSCDVGPIGPTLAHHAATASLLVIGHGFHEQARPWPPCVVTAATALADVPVLVRRPYDRGFDTFAPRPILVGVNPVPGSDQAIGFALWEAMLRATTVEARLVWSAPVAVDAEAPLAHGDAWRAYASARESARERLIEALAPWTAMYPDVKVISNATHDADPAQVLLDASPGAQLVVVGHSRVPDRPVGIGHTLVEHARCSVAAIPAATRQPISTVPAGSSAPTTA